MSKPENIDEYKAFIEERTKMNIEQLKSYYNNVMDNMLKEFENVEYVKRLDDCLDIIDNDYRFKTKFDLIDHGKSLIIKKKEFENMINKCYRIDILYNNKWKRKNRDWMNSYSWITPLNCYNKIGDLLRTRVIVRYLDGAKLTLNKFVEITKKEKLKKYKVEYIAYDKGYYGIHLNIIYPLKKLNLNYTYEDIDAKVEIQITTQIKEIINELLHEYYDKERMIVKDKERKWQWEYESKEFSPHYLGHISHYIEGMIIDARGKLREEL